MNNLFNFSRSLPAPFDKPGSKKVKVSSKYGDGTESTLSATMIKAVHAVCGCMNGSVEGAVGIIDHRYVAEYKSSVGPDEYHLVVYDSISGNLMASVYDKNTEVGSNYTLNSAGRDGAAVMMALVPLLMKDDEFDDNFQTYFDQRVAGYPDMTKTTEAMAILCDNAYRRIKDDTCSAHIKVTLDKSGNVLRVSQSHYCLCPDWKGYSDRRNDIHRSQGLRRKISAHQYQKTLRSGGNAGAKTGRLVHHSGGSCGYLQACP